MFKTYVLEVPIPALSQHFYNFYIFICRATSGTVEASEFPEHGLVRDGTPCGENLVCVNQTCVSIFPFVDNTKCLTRTNAECSGHGVSFCLMNFGLFGFLGVLNFLNLIFCNICWIFVAEFFLKIIEENVCYDWFLTIVTPIS